ncbi:hypothetical protein D3C78_1677090 [compost metagenome]
MQLVGKLEQRLLQAARPGLAHGQGNSCMQLGALGRGREGIGGFHYPLVGEAQAVLA